MRHARRFGVFGGIVVLAGVIVSGAVLGTGSAQAFEPNPDAAVERALEAEGPILMPAEEAMIEAKCGYARGERNRRNIRMEEGGILVCSNGRRVDDPEVRALAARIEQRVEARVNSVMARPEVRAALNGEIQARVRQEMRTVQPRIEAAMREADLARVRADIIFGPVERARLRADLERMLTDIERIDLDAVDRGIDAALERDLQSPDPAP